MADLTALARVGPLAGDVWEITAQCGPMGDAAPDYRRGVTTYYVGVGNKALGKAVHVSHIGELAPKDIALLLEQLVILVRAKLEA